MRVQRQLLIVAIIGAVALVAFAMFGNVSQAPSPAPLPSGGVIAPQDGGKATLTVNYGDGRVRKFTGPIIDGMTALDVLNQSSDGGKRFSLETKSRGDGTLWVEVLDGVKGDAEKKWQVYRNGADIDGRLAAESIRSGDQMEIRFE